MLCINVNQARIMVSAENFINVLFMNEVVRSYGHDREYVTVCVGIPQFVQPYKGLYLLPGPLHVRYVVPIRQCGPVHKVQRHRRNHVLERHTFPHFGHVAKQLVFAPLHTSAHSPITSSMLGRPYHHG